MSFKHVIYLAIMFAVVPVWLGYVWVKLLRIKGYANGLLHAWVFGFAVMLAVGQIVLVPLVALQKTLTTAVFAWKLCIQILAVGNALLWLTCRADDMWGDLRGMIRFPDMRGRTWTAVFGVLAFAMVLMQAYIPARYQHSDDDDARFIAEEVSAIEHDTMYVDSPIEAEFLYWNTGEVRKDLTSPWAMFVAMIAKDAGIAPAILSHAYLPFYFTVLCYALYALIGQKLFAGDWEKTFVFLIFLSVIHLAGYTSTHTLASMLLLRIWQGKAVCASFMLPMMFLLFCELLNRDCHRGWIAFCYVVSTGICLLSGIGIVTAPILIFIFGLIDICCHKNWRKTFSLWMSAVPCGVFLIYYLM